MDGKEFLRHRYGDGWSLQSYFAIYSKYNTTLLRGIMIALTNEAYMLSCMYSFHLLTLSVHAC